MSQSLDDPRKYRRSHEWGIVDAKGAWASVSTEEDFVVRKSVYVATLALALSGFGAAHAGEGCSYGSHAKKNDLEAPPPAATAKSEAVEKKLERVLSDKAS